MYFAYVESTHMQAIADDVQQGNFSRAQSLAENWMQQLPIGADRTAAESAYATARYFLHRQERLAATALGIERGRAFEEILKEISRSSDFSPVTHAAIMLCHAQIADNFARDFAGQKSYQLQLKDLLQLSYSLLVIGHFSAARDVLGFIIANNPTHAGAHYMAAWAANMTSNEELFFEHYREALYLRPEVVGDYPEFMPAGVFQDMMQLVKDEGYSDPGVRERIYALLLEVNGVYRHRRKLKIDEARQIEGEYQKLKQEYSATKLHKKAFEPRLLQLAAILIMHAHQMQNFEKFEHYRGEMISIDHSVWQSFQQNNIAEKK